MKAQRRFPLAPLLDIEPNVSELARQTRIHPRQFSRYRETGIPEFKADYIAIMLGRHPVEIWDNWLDDELETQKHIEAARKERRRETKRAYARRAYAEGREKKLIAQRAYDQEAANARRIKWALRQAKAS
jgi:hypothetical protein